MVNPQFNSSHADQTFLSCDWGTTSFRLTCVDAKKGHIIDRISGPEGIKVVHKEWINYNGPFSRIDFYLSFLKQKIELLETKVQADLRSCRIIISGMASSSIGIKELPYSRLPLNMKTPNLHMVKLPENSQIPHDIYLVSGLRSNHDVMRGEETQLLGLNYKYGFDCGTYLLAGTHSKHVSVQNRNAIDFKTFITGELYELISTQSILSQSVASLESLSIGNDFEQGVQQSADGNLLHNLFEVRTRDLIQKKAHSMNAHYLSGLLIGAELKELVNNRPAEIVIFGSTKLQQLYSRACAALELNTRCADTHSENDITALGHRLILQQILN